MSDAARLRELRDALAVAVREQAGAARYQRYQREVRSGSAGASEGPHLREFDADGFPIRQRSRNFRERVARILSAP